MRTTLKGCVPILAYLSKTHGISNGVSLCVSINHLVLLLLLFWLRRFYILNRFQEESSVFFTSVSQCFTKEELSYRTQSITIWNFPP